MSDLFTPGPVPTAAAPVVAPLISRSPLLDAEKLHVYRLAVQFQALANRLVPRQRGELPATLRDQLDRASVSIVLNIAEGAGRFSPPDKGRFYSIARGRATECGPVLDLLLARHLVSKSLHHEARSLIVRIVQMLTRLADRMTRRSGNVHIHVPGRVGLHWPGMDRVVAFVDDLMFLSRIREAAKARGLEVQGARTVADLLAACREAPRLVILDLDRGRPPANEALAALRGEPALASLPIVGFFSHVHADRGQQAREAGCTRAMPRSVFVKELDTLLASPPASR